MTWQAQRHTELIDFYYVYILVAETDPSRHYTGLTQDLEARLLAHNSGQVPHTSKYRPWRIETAVAFHSREKAAAFERYLKSHSGRAFAAKHF
jgi:putative endonuclease